jgi:FtsP/CotA-like multicopper oxidase with cupredoxin domain
VWIPEFFGTKVAVNGKVWPFLEVEPRRYRFRVLNGSNARFFDLRLSNGATFQQVGSDGGYLPAPVEMRNLVIAPAERCDVVVDFSKVKPGTRIVLTNVARTPFPLGEPVDAKTTGQVMEFRVTKTLDRSVPNLPLPRKLGEVPPLPRDLASIPVRSLFLNEVQGQNGPITGQLGGVPFDSPPSEQPRVGSSEIWELANVTGDTHQIHLHLVQQRVIGRQKIDADAYAAKAMPAKYPYLSAKDFLRGKPRAPEPNEAGWKDTVQMHPGEVTRVLVRFAPQDAPASVKPGVNAYPFDPTLIDTANPGYVWHCHILEHEEHDMMRPLVVN